MNRFECRLYRKKRGIRHISIKLPLSRLRAAVLPLLMLSPRPFFRPRRRMRPFCRTADVKGKGRLSAPPLFWLVPVPFFRSRPAFRTSIFLLSNE